MSEQLFIGRYKIIEEIGRGAMSVVYRAQDPDIERSLAIKLLKHDLIEQQEFRELFLREAKSAGRLSHPGIVTIYDMGIWKNRPFIAMELVEGQTLEEYLFEQGSLDLDQTLEFAKQISLALDYAHQNGVVHRDLKPDNIMVLEQGKRFKIADFGIAQIESQYLEETQQQVSDQQTDGAADSIDNKLMGTPAYMSPEQITGHGTDAKTDLYSLGVILYQLSKGELPYKAVNYAAMMQAVLQQNPQPLSINSESGLLWQSIIFRLLQKNPDLRYETSASLHDELLSLEQELKQNREGIASIRFVSMRARWAIMISAAVLLVMVLGIYWVNNKQHQLMSQLMYDYGHSITQIIGTETAEPLLLEEYLTLQAITNDIAQNSQILRLSIRDKDSKVRSSNLSKEIQQDFQLIENSVLVNQSSQNKIYSNDSYYKEKVFIFDSPISYQNKQIGWVNVALTRSNLQAATDSSLLTMVIWMFVILLAIFTGIYWMADRLTKRLNLSRNNLRAIRTNAQHQPLSINTHDELGRLQQEINQLSLQLNGLTETQKLPLTQNTDEGAELGVLEDINKTLVIDKKA